MKEINLYGMDEKFQKLYNACSYFVTARSDKNQLNKLSSLSIYPTFLFYGYPGTGKTSIALEIYNKLKMNNNIDLVHLNIDELLSSNFGVSSINLRAYFDNLLAECKNYDSTVFVVMEEIDSFAINRYQNDNESIKRVLLTFNTIIDELIRKKLIYNFIIIATTNMKELLDLSVTRRFFTHENFNNVVGDSSLKSGLASLFELCEIDVSQKTFTEITNIIIKKQISFGEIKSLCSHVYFDTVIFKQDSNRDLVEILQNYESFYEQISKQK